MSIPAATLLKMWEIQVEQNKQLVDRFDKFGTFHDKLENRYDDLLNVNKELMTEAKRLAEVVNDNKVQELSKRIELLLIEHQKEKQEQYRMHKDKEAKMKHEFEIKK